MGKEMVLFCQRPLPARMKKKPGKRKSLLRLIAARGAVKPCLFIMLALLCFTPGRSYGSVVSYTFLLSGTMTTESNAYEGPHLCSPGDAFSGFMRYTYDSDAQPIAGYYNGPDDFGEIYPNGIEYSLSFNDITIHTSTELGVYKGSYLNQPDAIELSSYGMWFQTHANDPKLFCTEGELSMLYHNPIITETNKLPQKLNAGQISDMGFWCYMSYDNYIDHPDDDNYMQNMFITVRGQVDTIIPAPVPEPSTMLLLCAGLLGLAGCRKVLRK